METALRAARPRVGETVRHLYVHVPFCHKICPYCAFHKHLPGAELSGYPGALTAEATLAAARHPLALETVYFGGGTPTLLSTAVLAGLLPALRKTLDFTRVTEWTMEVNPRTITPEKAALLRDEGVTRASLGVQAWDPATLATLGRDHSPDEAEEAFHMLRDAGFPAVNIDLMFSVPGQSVETWRETLARTVALRPDHISAYNLTYEEDTAFFDKVLSGEYRVREDEDADHFAAVIDMLGSAGFAHYEISNHAREGKRSRHNEAYWAGADYLGLGPGAVTTIGGLRTKNLENTALWTAGAMAGKIPLAETEEIDDPRWLCERIALSLRTAEGMAVELLPGAEAGLDQLAEEGLLTIESGRVRLTRAGKFVADGVAAFLWERVEAV